MEATDRDSRTAATAALMDRFNAVFLRHDPSTLPGMIAEDCVIEKINQVPGDERCVGRDACVALWSEIATAPGTHFDLEETQICRRSTRRLASARVRKRTLRAMGERAIIRWRLWTSDTASRRGVNLMRVRDGLIVEAMGYAKGA